MAAQKRKKSNINLLPQEEFAKSTAGRVLTWILSTFRIIVIVVELIVMGAFISRFFVDAKISNLNDDLEQRETIIKSYSNFEKDYRLTQQKLKIVSDLISDSKKTLPLLSETVSFLPDDISLIEWRLDENVVFVKGVGYSEQSIVQFIANLESSPKLHGVFLDQIDSRSDTPGIVFTLKANIEGGV